MVKFKFRASVTQGASLWGQKITAWEFSSNRETARTFPPILFLSNAGSFCTQIRWDAYLAFKLVLFSNFKFSAGNDHFRIWGWAPLIVTKCVYSMVLHSTVSNKKGWLGVFNTGGVYNTGNMCGYNTGIMWDYNPNHSKKNCAGMTAVRPITWKFGFFLPILAESCSFRSNFPISAKGHFGGFDFYNTNQSEISRRKRLL